jgi:hypothetical protein
MKNFDEAHDFGIGAEGVRVASREELLGLDRTFMLGGQEFKRRAILHPRIMARFWSLEGPIDQAMLDELYGIALACVEPDDRERLKARFDDEDDPISYVTLRELLAWFIAEDTGRPFEKQNESSPGSETTADSTSSTAESSSPEAEAVPKTSLSVAS